MAPHPVLFQPFFKEAALNFRNTFAEFVSASPETEPWLPLFHTCDGFAFRAVLRSQKLVPARCRVFNENLLYFFYGRPAYRTSGSATSTISSAFFPVALAINIRSIDPPVRIAPFDTGAFAAGLYEDHIHPRMTIGDFLLEPTLDMPSRVVSRFFETNGRYYHGQPATSSATPFSFEVESYCSLANTRATSNQDDRSTCVEIQVSSEVLINSDSLSLVVLPTVFLEDKELSEILFGRWGCSVRTYPIFRSAPQQQIALIYSHAYEFMVSNSLI